MILTGSATNVTSATTLNRATRVRVGATNAGTVTIAAATGTFNAQSAVAGAAITISSHGFVTGDEVTYSDGGGTAIAELTDGGQFFVTRVDANTINLSTTLNGTALTLTDAHQRTTVLLQQGHLLVQLFWYRIKSLLLIRNQAILLLVVLQ